MDGYEPKLVRLLYYGVLLILFGMILLGWYVHDYEMMLIAGIIFVFCDNRWMRYKDTHQPDPPGKHSAESRSRHYNYR